MKNLSEIYQAVEALRLQKMPYDEIRKLLIRNGRPEEDVMHVTERLENKEMNDYLFLKEEVNKNQFIMTSIWEVGKLLVGIGLFFCSIYFAIDLYTEFTAPQFIEIDGTVYEVDDENKIMISWRLLILAIGCLVLSLPLVGSVIQNLKKLKRDRRRFLFIRERMNVDED